MTWKSHISRTAFRLRTPDLLDLIFAADVKPLASTNVTAVHTNWSKHGLCGGTMLPVDVAEDSVLKSHKQLSRTIANLVAIYENRAEMRRFT